MFSAVHEVNSLMNDAFVWSNHLSNANARMKCAFAKGFWTLLFKYPIATSRLCRSAANIKVSSKLDITR